MSAQHVISQQRVPAWQYVGRDVEGEALILTCVCGWRTVLEPHTAASQPAVQAVISGWAPPPPPA